MALKIIFTDIQKGEKMNKNTKTGNRFKGWEYTFKVLVR